MSFREGRGRPRRDYPLRAEEKSHHGRGNNPPSRHLWVGNLSHSLTESDLAHYFLRYGDLESIAFQPGRSYAFINYRNDEDAFAAIKELQGFLVAGNPLRIEFTKAEKSSIPPSRDSDYSDHPKSRGSPFSQRDYRGTHHSSPDLSSSSSHPNRSKMSDKDAEPSEVLWIGFPAQLKMDEFVLRKAFSPFGEIEKITAFPGRTYAFVRFRHVMAAARAKEALHGKLFGNPRVHICFAKNESGPSNRERTPPRVGSYGRPGSFERPDRSPPFIPSMDRGDPNVMSLSRNLYEYPNSPPRKIGAHIREFSPQKYNRKGPIYDDPWDLPEDVSLLHGTKKLKTNKVFLPENELPEYPFSDLEKSKHVTHHDIPLDKNYNSRHSGYRPIPEGLMNKTRVIGERGDQWNDDFQGGLIPLPIPERRRLMTPDLRESSSKDVWKWEGMIAKGGTSVCRARCFPVGKPPDMLLPEYLDCTARTSLDMLAKHYYQSASAWVVFFVPATDPDISYYNEFMNYLVDKQRAAVAKLDERTTLFLVPPSDFSEKVLKVPGKLSISGVVLRLDPPPPNESREKIPFTPFQNDYTNHPENFPSSVGPTHSVNRQGHDYWPQHPNLQRSNPVIASHSSDQSYSAMHRPMMQEPPPHHSSYTPDNVPNMQKPQIPAEQLAQLASSLLGQQQGQSEYKPLGNTIDQSGYLFRTSQNNYGYLQNEQISPEFTPQSQFAQVQQQAANLAASQREAQANQQFQNGAPQTNQQVPSGGGQDDAEGDPQQRLQATLQLAAALLQQIQQGKGT